MGTNKRRVTYDLKIPVLIEILVEDKLLTIRAYKETTESVTADSHNAITHIGQHDNDYSDTDYPIPSLPFDGSLLHERFAGKTFIELNAYSLDFNIENGIRESQEWGDHTLWTFPIDRRGFLIRPYNHTNITTNSIGNPGRSVLRHEYSGSCFVAVPFANNTLDESSIILRCHPSYGYISNIEFENMNTEDAPWDRNYFHSLFPKIVFESEPPEFIDPNGTRNIAINIIDPITNDVREDANCELYITTTGGYLPKNRISVQNGRGSFNIQALGLSTGENFTVSIGYRLYPEDLNVDLVVI